MIKDGITGQKRMAKLYGSPASGMLWCSGFETEPHQVPAGEIYPNTCRCRDCRSRCNEQYRNLAPKRVDVRQNRRAPTESDVRYVEPGRNPPSNEGALTIALPSWGYVPLDRSPSRVAARYDEKVTT